MADFQKQLEEHFKEDERNFANIDKNLCEIKEHMKVTCSHMEKSTKFMENMSGVNDFVRGTTLLKKPLMVFAAIVLGIVALMGGLRTIISWFIIK